MIFAQKLSFLWLLSFVISRLHEILRKDKSSDRDRDLVAHLRQEVNTRTHELSNLKSELQSSNSKNERLTIELETLRSGQKQSQFKRHDLERISSINQDLSNEMENIKKNVMLISDEWNFSHCCLN